MVAWWMVEGWMEMGEMGARSGVGPRTEVSLALARELDARSCSMGFWDHGGALGLPRR